MPDFQITIVSAQASPGRELEHVQLEQVHGFEVNQHRRGDNKIVDKIEDLEEIWGEVITRLTDLAAKSHVAALASQFELSEIEFNIGVEAGLNVGLVTKGNASVSITFARKTGAAPSTG